MAPPVSAGDVLGGKYRVERVLGEGGMGVVVAATHMQLQERVALKFLLLEVSEGSELATRFLREAQAAFKIKSEHVARVSDVGTLENGAPYMVMEYLEGTDLAGVLETSGRLPVELTIEYILQACEAIAEAHKAGIVHRDLKPANLFLTHRSDGSPCIKVLDFGISKLAQGLGGGAEANLTRTTGIMGTPLYMSPEQLRASRDVDARADIWSLGVILFELLTRSLPFSNESVAELCAAILTQPAPRVRALRGEVPEGVEAAITKCLKKDREDRFANVAELAAALAPFAAPHARISVDRIVRTTNPEGLGASPPMSSGVRRSSATAIAATIASSGSSPSHPRFEEESTPPPVDPPRNSPARWVAVVAATLVIVGAGLAMLWMSRASAPKDAPRGEAATTASPNTSVSSTQAASTAPPTVEAATAAAAVDGTEEEDEERARATMPATGRARPTASGPARKRESAEKPAGKPAPRKDDGEFGGRR